MPRSVERARGELPGVPAPTLARNHGLFRSLSTTGIGVLVAWLIPGLPCRDSRPG